MPSTATITSSQYYSFTAGNRIKSAEVNSNFSVLRGHFIPIDLTASASAPTRTYDLGASDHAWNHTYSKSWTAWMVDTTTAAPNTAPSGYISIYAKSDLRFYQKDTSGTESLFSAVPMTTKGDLPVFTTVPARLAMGTDGQVLTVDTTTSSGLKWAAASSASPTYAVTTKTTTYTATSSDDVILVDSSTASWTLELFTAVGNTGQTLFIKKISSDSNVVTIDGNGAQTIDGVLTISLRFPNEAVELTSDGVGWRVIAQSGQDTLSSTASDAGPPAAAGQYGDATSLSLSTGKWLLSAHGYFRNGGIITTTNGLMGIGTSNTNTSVGLFDETSQTQISPMKSLASGAIEFLEVANLSVNVTATSTYYLKVLAGGSVANLAFGGRLTATKVSVA